MEVTLLDLGAGNLHSLAQALRAAGAVVRVEPDPVAAARRTDGLLAFPGVGAFGHAAQRLLPAREPLRAAVARGVGCIGICLGMQLFFDESEEGDGLGLSLFPGRVERLSCERVPHMGWNTLEAPGDGVLRAALPEAVYYAHSYVCRPVEASDVTAWTTHESERFPAAVRRGRVVGFQFHPEKSGAQGVRLLQAYLAELSR